MENKILKAIGFSAMGLILVICTLIIVRWATDFLDWARFEAGDLGTWVGAIGTVGALFGTIWLATSEQRTQRERSEDLAFMAYASVGIKIRHVQAEVQKAVEHFTDEHWIENGYQYSVQADLIDSAGTWTDEEILPLIAVRGHVAARLVGARSALVECVKAMRDLAETQNYSFVYDKKDQLDRNILKLLFQSQALLSQSISHCTNFAAQTRFR